MRRLVCAFVVRKLPKTGFLPQHLSKSLPFTEWILYSLTMLQGTNKAIHHIIVPEGQFFYVTRNTTCVLQNDHTFDIDMSHKR